MEPAALSGMLAAQNQVRARLGLQPLVWSASLTESAGALARTASVGACTLGTADKALRGKDVSLHWAAAIRRFGGARSRDFPSPLVRECVGGICSEYRCSSVPP